MQFKAYRSGKWVQQYEYKSFSPAPINHEWTWEDPRINTLLEDATRALGELNAFSLIVPDVDLFIQMHVAKEASTSSRIEGTQTSMETAIRPKETVPAEKRDDWQEVQNYIHAMNHAVEDLKRLPLSNRLIKETHGILMKSVRGERKGPGEFRRSQNWIGATLKDAVFIPPHDREIGDLMGDLESFWHNEQIEVPHLVRIALSHYQFEAIHPFQDGNGRIGRLLIPLYLVSKGLLAKPSLYLSSHLEQFKGPYFDALTQVRSSSDLGHWVRFFLVAVSETAKKGKETFRAILELRNETEDRILRLGKRAEKAKRLLALLYRHPFISIKEVASHLDITPQSANLLVKELMSLGILEETTGFQRNRYFVFRSYLELFR